MKVIYISTMVSNKKMNFLLKKSIIKPLQSIQKFNKLLCEGLLENNITVSAISSIPVSRKMMKKTFWFEKKEIENNILYKYLFFVNIPILRQFFLGLSAFLTLFFSSLKDRKDLYFICDALNPTISSMALMVAKMFNIKCFAITTDLPEFVHKNKFIIGISNFLISKYDGYIFLTEPMNQKINTYNRPYIILEGICDNYSDELSHIEKYDQKTFIYAGGLYEKYGLKNLILAFKKIKNTKAELHIYGAGSLSKYIKSLKIKNVKYYGVVENAKVINAEKKAHFLVNPRFSNDEYTKYSFPSKNMEYLSTGTPVLTTRLEGIPKEYDKYFFYFDAEDVEGMKIKIEELINMKEEDATKKGLLGKKFVENKKNKKVQALKVKEMITSCNMDKKSSLLFHIFNLILFLIFFKFCNISFHFSILLLLLLLLFAYDNGCLKLGMKKNYLLWVIALFSISYTTISYINTGTLNYYLLILPTSILICGILLVRNFYSDKNCKIIVFSMILGYSMHGLLNFLTNLTFEGRNTVDIWSKKSYSATLQGTFLVNYFSLLYYVKHFKYNRILKTIYYIIFVLLGIYVLRLGTRTTLLVTVVCYFATFLYHSFLKRDKMTAFLSKGIKFATILLVIILLYNSNVFHIKNILENTNLFERFHDTATSHSDVYRFEALFDSVKQIFKFPFGGNQMVLDNISYAHNMWLDTANAVGIIPFIFLLIFTVLSLLNIVNIFKNINISASTKIFLFSIFISFIINFFTEPILIGEPLFFLGFCLLSGILYALSRGEKD